MYNGDMENEKLIIIKIDGRIVNEDTKAVRVYPDLDLATVRRARIERGWTVLYESI